jgi:hypothetical protein
MPEVLNPTMNNFLYMIKHELLPLNDDFVTEKYCDMLTRYSGFGCEIFSVLQERLPEIFAKLEFFRATKYQTGDVYAIYDDGAKAFSIQLDPDIEVIVLWNEQIQTEIGEWSKDVYGDAISFIHDELLGKK